MCSLWTCRQHSLAEVYSTHSWYLYHLCSMWSIWSDWFCNSFRYVIDGFTCSGARKICRGASVRSSLSKKTERTFTSRRFLCTPAFLSFFFLDIDKSPCLLLNPLRLKWSYSRYNEAHLIARQEARIGIIYHLRPTQDARINVKMSIKTWT